MSVEEEKKFVINQVFKNVKSLPSGEYHFGKKEKRFNLFWQIGLYKYISSPSLAIVLLWHQNGKWSIDTKIVVSLLTKTGEIFTSRSRVFNKSTPQNFLFEREALDTYLVKGDVTVECHVAIRKMTKMVNPVMRRFDEHEFSDVVLKVEDQKFHVNKMYLASHSAYFATLFFGHFDESKQSVVELKDIDPADFQSFLEIIHGEPSVDKSNADGILQLADMYYCETATRQCEHFLNRTKKSMPRIKTVEDLENVLLEGNTGVDPQVWAEILKMKRSVVSFDDGKGKTVKKYGDIRKYLGYENQTIKCHWTINEAMGIKKSNLKNFHDKDFSDVALVVNDKKFHVLKHYLAFHSTYFKSLFFGNFGESGQSEVELKGIDPDDFQNFLEFIHGEPAIDDDTIEGILHLADMYDAKTAIRHCENFLLYNSQKNLKFRLGAAVKHNLHHLKKKCMSEIESVKDLETVMSGGVNNFDNQIWTDLMNLSIEFYHKK